MTVQIPSLKSLFGRVLTGSRPASRSLAYRNNKKAIWHSRIPDKYTRLVDLVPGERILELGSAEGVLSLTLAQTKTKVFALELNEERHAEANRLKAFWQLKGLDVERCQLVQGNIKDRLDLLDLVDTLVAVRSIYYLREDLKPLFEAIGQRVPNVVLCGNKHRARKYREGVVTDSLGPYNYYATLEGMTALLEGCGYTIDRTVPNGDPIVVAKKTPVEAIRPRP